MVAAFTTRYSAGTRKSRLDGALVCKPRCPAWDVVRLPPILMQETLHLGQGPPGVRPADELAIFCLSFRSWLDRLAWK